MIIPFILSVIAWPLVTFLSVFILSKLLMPLFNYFSFRKPGIEMRVDYSLSNVFQAIVLVVSQILVVAVAKSIFDGFGRWATAWLAIPFGLWCFAFGPMSWQINHYLKAKYEGVSSSSFEKHLGGSWTIGLGIGWVIGTILLLNILPMIIMLEAIAIQITAFVVLWIFLLWICNNHPRWRNATGFIVELGSAYSAGFVFDMLTQVGIGILQFGNVVTPVITWTAIAIACHILASNVALSVRALYIPYILNGGIAMIATMVKLHNIFIALPLLVVAFIIYQLESPVCAHGAVMFELGGYRLDQDISDVKGKMEDFSHVFGVGSLVRMFSDEKVFKANQVNFLGETWDCMLGVTNNKIYKIALSGELTSNIFNKANNHFLGLYGKPTESQSNEESKLNIWDFPSANLVVSQHHPFNVINIIATSGTPFKRTNPNVLVPK